MVTKRKFWTEMNRHKNTKYRCVNSTYIVEYGCGSLTETNTIAVWRHISDGGPADSAKGEEGYPHDWVKVGGATVDPENGETLWDELTTEKAILAFRDDEDRNMNWWNPGEGE